MEITAKMVSELREKTGVGMMKCKEALVECKGNLQEAYDALRKKGLASADSKAGRKASQGWVAIMVSPDGHASSMLELNCETDFVALTAEFQQLTQGFAAIRLNNKNLKTAPELSEQKFSDGQVAEEKRKLLVAKVGENMVLSRNDRLEIAKGSHGIFDIYVHGDNSKVEEVKLDGKTYQFGRGRIGVLVQIETANPDAAKHDDVRSFAHEVALQICSMKARFLSRTDIASNVVDHEKEIILGQIKNDPKNANKPENVMAKIVEGRLDKFYKEFCLLEQVYVKDDTKTVKDLVADLSKKMGGEVKISAFRRWELGEQTA